MKSNRPPDPAKRNLHPSLANDPQVIKWTQRLKGDRNARPTDLTEDQLASVVLLVVKQRGEAIDPSLFTKKMIETRPLFAAPDFTDLEEDLELIHAQPEMKAFWQNWTTPQKPKGPTPNVAGAKAVMTALGMGGVSSHVDTVHELVEKAPDLRKIFATLEGKSDIAIAPYSTTCRHMKALGQTCTMLAIEANIEFVKALRKMFPKARIGKRLLLDSCPVPAWAAQKGSNGNEKTEAFLRRRTPDAGFRLYSYGNGGKSPLDENAKVKPGTAKRWRGYFFSVIVDQVTGLPLVWLMHDAGKDEAAAIVPLLSLLHKLWPDIGAELIAADSAWHEERWVRLCEVDYGIALIARQKPSERDSKAYITKDSTPKPKDISDWARDGQVAAITPLGELVCTAHGKPLAFEDLNRPSRTGLLPGQTSNERQFRLRGVCNHTSVAAPHACGRIGLKAAFCWRRLTRYPHHGNGHPERYAMRMAMLTRLNQVEGLFNRLKAGKILGIPGASRTRVLDIHELEALFSLACLSMTALMVAEQRLLANQPAAGWTRKTIAIAPTPAVQPVTSAPQTTPTTPAGPTTATVPRAVITTAAGVFKRGRRRAAA